MSFFLHHQTEPEPAHGLQAKSPWGAPEESPSVRSTLQSRAGAQQGAGCCTWVGPGRVPGSPPRLAELAAAAAWEPRAGRWCSSQVLLWEFLAAACAPCKIPGGIFSAGRRDVYHSGREDFCSQGSVCVERRWSTSCALGQGRHGAGSLRCCCTPPWLQGVAARGNHAGLLTSNAPPTSLLGWVGPGSGDISGQRFTNRGHSSRLFAPKSCLG